MFTVAKVVVDVPSAQTNQCYDYLIPNNLAEDISIGYRVRVPFGPRLVLGFVVDIQVIEDSEYTLRPIHSLLDTYPVLNAELIQLSFHLAHETFSFYINALLTMLPALFKANYRKVVHWLGSNHLRPALFNEENTIDLIDVTNLEDIKQLLKWHKEGIVSIVDVVDDKAKKKYGDQIVKLVDVSEMVVSDRAVQQQKLRDVLNDKTVILRSELTKCGIGPTTIQTFVKNQWIKVEKVVLSRNPYEHAVFEKVSQKY